MTSSISKISEFNTYPSSKVDSVDGAITRFVQVPFSEIASFLTEQDQFNLGALFAEEALEVSLRSDNIEPPDTLPLEIWGRCFFSAAAALSLSPEQAKSFLLKLAERGIGMSIGSFELVAMKAFFPSLSDKEIHETLLEWGIPIEELNFSVCNEGMDWVSKFSSLKRLDLQMVSLTDADLVHFTSLIELKELNISYNELLTKEGLLCLPRSLESLDLTACMVFNADIKALCSHLIHLKKLYLTGCKYITNQSLEEIVTFLPFLEHLDIGLGKVMKISEAGIFSLRSLSCLQTLNMTGYGASSCARLADLAELPLKELCLNSCRTADFSYLSPFTTLEHLNLSHCPQLTDQGLASVTSLVNLKHLLLYGTTTVGDENFWPLQSLSNLSRLAICVHLKVSNLSFLSQMTSLQTLDLSLKHAEDSDLSSLKPLILLSHLTLHVLSPKISEKGLETVLSLPSLAHLELKDKKWNWYILSKIKKAESEGKPLSSLLTRAPSR